MDAFTIARIVLFIGLALILLGILLAFTKRKHAIACIACGVALVSGAALADMNGMT